MFTVVGYCPRCGAPIYSPSSWAGTLPSPSYHSCNCFADTKTYSTNTTNPYTININVTESQDANKLMEEITKLLQKSIEKYDQQ